MSDVTMTSLAAILGAEGSSEFTAARKAVLSIGRESARMQTIETMAELIEEAEELGTEGANQLVKVAQTLQDRRAFALLLVLCLLAGRSGLSTPRLKQKEIQALIELKRLREAIREARKLIDATDDADPDTPADKDRFDVWKAAQGNLGRGLKQTYVNAALALSKKRSDITDAAAASGGVVTDDQLEAGLAELSRPDPTDLKEAAQAYLAVWDKAKGRGSTYQAINAAALISRAARDALANGGSSWARDEDARRIAEAILHIHSDDLRAALGQGSSPNDIWTLATCGEAFLVLGQMEDAARCYGAYAGNPANTAFNLASSLRQLEEVWTLSGDDPGTGGSIVRVQKAALLNLDKPAGEDDDDAVDDVPREAVQLSVKEARLIQSDLENAETDGATTSAGFEAYFGKRGHGKAAGSMVDVARLTGAVRRARSICAIKVLRGGEWVPGGTGFVMDGGALHAGWAGQSVIVTNHHVTAQNDAALSSSFKRCQAVFVDIDPTDGNDLEYTVGFESVLWASGHNAHDTVVLKPVRALPPDAAPLSDTDITDYLPKRRSADRDGTDMHVVILGFPGERKLSYSFGDELLLDHNACPPGKAPRTPPVLDGAPINLHYRTPSLPGSSGSPVFEAGTWKLVGIHHRGRPDTPRLSPKDKVPPSSYEANEGIWLQSIKAAIAADAASMPPGQESLLGQTMVHAGNAILQEIRRGGHSVFAKPIGAGAPPARAGNASMIPGNYVPFQDDDSHVRRRYLRRGLASEDELGEIDAHAQGFETVIGDDNRVQILDTVTDPFRMICSLVIWHEGGLLNYGTGFLIGRRTLVTAGHCLMPFEGAPGIERIEIRPGRAGPREDMEPFLHRLGPIEGKHFSVHEGWAANFDPRVDIGAIHLDKPIGDDLGWFRVASRQPGGLNRVWGHVTGFPGDKITDGGKRATEMWHHATPITAVADQRVYYPADTFAGQSGAPVYVIDDDDRACVIGVHAYGTGPNAGDLAHNNNSAVHVDEGILQLMADWRTVE